jgi:hypothetical protein
LVEHIIATGLHFLSGVRPKDLQYIMGCSPRAAFLAVDDFIDAVNAAPEVDINLMLSIEEWLSINVEWKKKSTNEIIAGCVGALDGFSNVQVSLLKKELPNQISYYSRHYESFGLNC